MFNICPNCGNYHVDKEIVHREEGSFAICNSCQFEIPFVNYPLFFLTGPSGVGKSTIAYRLLQDFKDVIVIESDIFWIDELKETGLTRHELMLRVAKNAMQSGKPVLIAGTVLPQHLKESLEKRYFKDLHFIVLTYSPEDTRKRLEARPWWRESGNEAYIQDHLDFNEWILNNLVHNPLMLKHIHTSDYTIDETEQMVKDAIQGVLQKLES